MPVIETTNQPVVVEATGVPEVVEFTENQVTIEAPVTQVTVDFPGSARLIAGEGLEGGGLMQGDVDISLSAAALASLASADSAVQPGDDVSDLTNDADYQSGAQVTAAINALGTVYQPLDADLSAVAALSSLGLVARTAAGTFATRTLTGVTNQTDVTNGNGVAGNPTVGLAAAVLASLALANSAVQPGGPVSDFTNDVGYQTYGQVLVLISSAGVGYQPLDSDLTAIAALGTTSFGRGLLTLADAAATKALLDLEIGTDLQAYSSNLDLWSALAPSAKQDVSAKLTAYAGGDTPSAFTLGIVDSTDAAAWRTALSVYSTTQVDTAIAGVVSDVAAGYQPLDADLTAIAALATTTFGRSLLTLADAAAVRAVLDLEVGIDVQAYSAVLDAYAATTPDAYSLGLLSLDSAGAWRAAIGAGVPYTANALTRTNDTNITLTLGGTPATALLQAVSMTLGWTGTLAKDRGGFGEDASALTTTIAELNYVDGVTSNIQTQLDAKQAHSTVLDNWALGPSPSAFTLSLVNLTNASDWWVAIGAGVPTYDAGSGLDFTAGIFSIDYTYTGYWQAPIGFDNQDTATVDEIFWAMRVVDDPGVWSFYAQSDDGSTRANFLAVTRGTGVSIASMVYGNATDYAPHEFYGHISSNFEPTSGIDGNFNGVAGINPVLNLYATAPGAEDKGWCFWYDSAALTLRFSAVNDVGNAHAYYLRILRAGLSIVSQTYGNVGDSPMHAFKGTLRVDHPTQPFIMVERNGSSVYGFYSNGVNTGGLYNLQTFRNWMTWTNTNFEYGNSTDYPSHTVYGVMTLNLGGAYATPQLIIAGVQYGIGVNASGTTFFKNTNNGTYLFYDAAGNASVQMSNSTLTTYSDAVYFHSPDNTKWANFVTPNSAVNFGIHTWDTATSLRLPFYIYTSNLIIEQALTVGTSITLGGSIGNTVGTTGYAGLQVHGYGSDPNWTGIKFTESSSYFMWSRDAYDASPQTGVYKVGVGWIWLWTGGTLTNGTVPYARLSDVGTAAQYNQVQGTYTANYIPRFDSSGYLWTYYISSATSNSENPTISQFVTTNGSDNYYRKSSLAHAANAIRSTSGGAYDYFWSNSHPTTYYLENNWDGTYWYITSNHGSPVRVGYADVAGSVSGGGGSALGAAKTSSTSRSSTTSETADPALQIGSVPAGTYMVTLLINWYQNSAANQGIRLKIAGTNLTVKDVYWESQADNTANLASWQTEAKYAVPGAGTTISRTNSSSSADSLVKCTAWVVLSGTGTIEFHWAQASSNGSPTVVNQGAMQAVKIA